MEYRVVYAIDVTADDPSDAAQVAYDAIVDKDAFAPIFDVYSEHGSHFVEQVEMARPPAGNHRLALRAAWPARWPR